MKKQLELKHLAAYLPYGLKIQGQTHGDIETLSCCTETSVNIVGHDFQYGMWADIFDIKPLLRPLSDLTKQITDNGETFFPVDKLRREFVNDHYEHDDFDHDIHFIQREGYLLQHRWQTYLKRTPERTVLLASDRARGFLEGTDGEKLNLKQTRNASRNIQIPISRRGGYERSENR